MLFIDLAVSPPFSPSSSAQSPRAFHGQHCWRFHKALTAVCSFLLLPSHQGPAAAAKTRHHLQGARSFIAQRSRRGEERAAVSGRNGLSLDTSALFMGCQGLSQRRRAPGVSLRGLQNALSLLLAACYRRDLPWGGTEGWQGTGASSCLLLMQSPRLSQHRAFAEQPRADLAKTVSFST